MCNIEFPHFGASYPDAHCINGYLWDMDSYENGCYTIGGDDPCPFCNTEAWLKTVLDNEEFASREEALEWVEKMREKWEAEHRGSSEIPKDLEEAAIEYSAIGYSPFDDPYEKHQQFECSKFGFIAGAKWQKEQMPLPEDTVLFNKGVEEGKRLMMEDAVEIGTTEICWVPDGDRVFPTFDPPVEDLLMPGIMSQRFNGGDKVRVIIIKKED